MRTFASTFASIVFRLVCVFYLLLVTEIAPATVEESPLHGRYVLLGPPAGDGKPAAIARAIIAAGDSCPTITGDSELRMSTRENPHGFAIKVCEALIPFNQELQLLLAGRYYSLPTVKENPGKILVMGDSGCEAEKTKKGKTSGCKPGTPAEPFASQAAAANQDAWDLILHMGDYNYRGTSSKVTIDGKAEYVYDAGDGTKKTEHCLQTRKSGFISQNAPGSKAASGQSARDTWQAWSDDFFSAAGELLAAAPWVLARGNHELCSRAGPGWFYFLDASSSLLPGGQKSCPAANPGGNPFNSVVMIAPYAVNLGSLNLLVLDSANACDAYASKSHMQDFLDAYVDQFNQIGAQVPEDSITWLMSHRPLWGVKSYHKGTTTECAKPGKSYSCINQTLQYAVEHATRGTLPGGIRLLLAGHMHHFQSITHADKKPPQLVIGTSGVQLSSGGPVGTFKVPLQGKSAQGRSIATAVKTKSGAVIDAHGYLGIDYDASGSWHGTLRNGAKKVNLAKCGSEQTRDGSVCEFSVTPMSR